MEKKLSTIVGFGPGIGSATARVFARAGSTSRCSRAIPRSMLRKRNSSWPQAPLSRAFTADAAEEASLQAGLEKAHGDHGATAVMLYNAFAFRSGRPTTLTAAQLTSDFQTAVAGGLTAAKLRGGRNARGPSRNDAFHR